MHGILALLAVVQPTTTQPLANYLPTPAELVANYKRSSSLQNLAQGAVRQLTLVPAWASDEAFTYVKELGNGESEYVLVRVTRSGVETGPAFDHAKLAEAISKEANVKATAKNLPITRFTMAEDLKSATFAIGNQGYKVDFPAYTLSKVNLPATGGQQRPGGRRGVPQVGNRPVIREGKIYMAGAPEPIVDSAGYASAVITPDRKYIIGFKLNPGDRRKVYLVKSAINDTTRGVLEERLYDQPGDKLDTYEPYVIDINNRKETKVGLDPIMGGGQPWSSPPGITFSTKTNKAYIQYPIRGYQENRLVEIDPATASYRNIIEEKSKTFVDQGGIDWRLLEDTDEVIWRSERSGWAQYYLIDLKTAKVKNAITTGNWVVRKISDLDLKNRFLTFTGNGLAAGQDPYQLHVYRASLDGKTLVDLTPGDGSHTVTWSPNRKYYLDTYSRVDLPPVYELRNGADGKLLSVIAKADDSKLKSNGIKPVQRFVAEGRDGKTPIYGIAVYPTHFDKTKKYPVIEYIYAGPHDSHVPKTYRPFLNMHRLAELGFIVVQIDGMGTNNRGKAFHDVAWKNIKDAGFPDRIAWIKKFAQAVPQADITRVGIYGTSAGGQNSMGAMLWHPEFYKVAVSSCGCHDNRIDKQWWNEQWMGYPVGSHYDEQSNITNAHKLQGKLMLIVGEQDRNVPPESTYRLADALIKAKKEFELVVIPGADHTDGGPYGDHKRRDFFVKHLLGVNPPSWSEVN